MSPIIVHRVTSITVDFQSQQTCGDLSKNKFPSTRCLLQFITGNVMCPPGCKYFRVGCKKKATKKTNSVQIFRKAYCARKSTKTDNKNGYTFPDTCI